MWSRRCRGDVDRSATAVVTYGAKSEVCDRRACPWMAPDLKMVLPLFESQDQEYSICGESHYFRFITTR
jgi:hypothetical protein